MPSPLKKSLSVLALLVALVGRPAVADELIQTPTADRVVGPTVSYRYQIDGDHLGYATALLPIGLAYELMFRYYHGVGGRDEFEGGVELQLLPDGIVTPGIAVGIWDVTNSSPFGRRAFLVLTKSLERGQFGLPPLLGEVQMNLGFGTGRFSGLFLGARTKLTPQLSLIAEFDSRRLNAGIWFQPTDQFTLKLESQNRETYLGGEFRLRF